MTPRPGQRTYPGRVAALYAWLRRHPKLVDGVLAAALAFTGVVPAVVEGRYLVIPLALGVSVPVVFRRAHPVGAFATVITIGGVQVLTNLRAGPFDLAVVILLYTLAAYKPRRTSLRGLAVCLLGSAVAVAKWLPPGKLGALEWVLTGSILFAGPLLIAWVLGDSMRYRRAYY